MVAQVGDVLRARDDAGGQREQFGEDWHVLGQECREDVI